MVWVNQDLILYHGTTNYEVSFQPNTKGRLEVNTGNQNINITAGNPIAEFGSGFYTTANIEQAKIWANSRAKIKMSRRFRTPPAAVIVRFSIDRNLLSQLKHIAFVKDTDDYWEFVEHCRSGQPQRPNQTGPYDVVYGPMSRRGDRKIIPNSDQVSFHTEDALKIIPPASLAVFGNPIIP